MDYLDKYDAYKRKHCVELSIKDKLRTGFSNKNQLQQGLNLFRKNNKVSVDDAKLMTILYPDVRDKVRIGQVISSGNDQLRAIYDDGIEDNTLSERSSGGYAFLTESESGSEPPTLAERDYDSPPASAVAIEDRVGQQIQQLIAQYEMGRITETELGEAILQQEERFAQFEEAPTGETRVSGMGMDTRQAPTLRLPAPPIRTMDDLPRETDEGGYVPPTYIPA
tara:strand:- start:4400 stop:5068 length:669 start_codon:yes stop_codon:yes gene_type:complete